MLPRRVEALMVQEVDGEVIILDTAANRVHQLNRTATLIWQSCDTASDPEEIAERLAAEFAVELDIVLADVLRTLEDLRAVDLLAKS